MHDNMLIDMTPMLSGETDRIVIDTTYLPEENESFRDIIFSSPMHIAGSVTDQAGYMHLTIEITLDYTALCARCLRELDRHLVLEVEKTVAVSGTLENEDADEIIDDYVLIENSTLDLTEAVEEQLFLELPYRHLCREDCRGLCSKCGKDLNEGDCDCPKHEADPRLAALKALLENKED